MSKIKIGILGGGLAGLSLRYFLQQETEILEKEPECGGLCRSIQENGFVFDQGGHILFSKDQGVLDIIAKILGDNVEKRRRNNKVYYDKRFIKYPFENGLSGLSLKDNFECLYYYLRNNSPSPTNFREWIYFTFGKGIAEKYLMPYNEKIWKFDLEKMSLEWVARVPKPPVRDIIKSFLGIPTEGYTHQLFYRYPKNGGIQALIRSLEMKKDDPITKNFIVNKIAKANDKWVVSNGVEEKIFDKLVSTMPIFDLIKCMESVPSAVLTAISQLKYNPLIVVMLGLDKDMGQDYTAVYFPDKDVPYHRICFMNNFSPNNAPKGKASIVAEISTREKDDIVWNKEDKDLISPVIDNLDKRKIIDKHSVSFAKVHRIKYAYVIYDLECKKNLSVVKEFIASCGVELLGRFAEFEYINMDEVIDRSVRMARQLNAM